MEKYTVIKNGLVLTLDRRSQTGYFNLVIKNGKIFFIDYDNKLNEKEFKSKNPDAEIIDAKNKLIMPGLFNSKLISSYSLNKLFLKKCSYENINSWLSLNFIDKYLSSPENNQTLVDLLKISYSRALLNGELFVNESSISIKKNFFDTYFTDPDWIKQYFNLTTYDYTMLNNLRDQDGFISIGFRTDEDINNYSLSSLKKSLSGNRLRLFIDGSLSQRTSDSVKKIFGKSFISVLSELDLITGGTVISNPVNLNSNELEILKKKKATILISPSDYLNMSERKNDLDELIFSGINIIIGTGYTGNDILSELKILPLLVSSKTLSYESIMKMVVFNPSLVFGISNVTGSIERNKSADLILFDTEDIRNTLSIPEIDNENISEFIIKNLSAKDISDVILKGTVLIKYRKELFPYSETEKIKASEISDKLYAAGKYFEFKEKYLMRGRVDKLGLYSTEEESEPAEREEIFVDMTETGDYAGEGEFTILGAKEEEFEKPRQRDVEKEPALILKEIKSIDDDLNLFEGMEDSQQFLKPKKFKKKDRAEKEAIQISGDNPQEEIKLKDEKDDIAVKETIVPPEEIKEDSRKEETAKSDIKTAKLKFGFKEDE